MWKHLVLHLNWSRYWKIFFFFFSNWKQALSFPQFWLQDQILLTWRHENYPPRFKYRTEVSFKPISSQVCALETVCGCAAWHHSACAEGKKNSCSLLFTKAGGAQFLWIVPWRQSTWESVKLEEGKKLPMTGKILRKKPQMNQ